MDLHNAIQEYHRLQDVLDTILQTLGDVARGLAQERHPAPGGHAAAVRILREGLRTIHYPFVALEEFERVAQVLGDEHHPVSGHLVETLERLRTTLQALHRAPHTTHLPPVTTAG